ncbi:hypothetical protein FRB99_008236 [Tulasnella sp. 403]|nr:hypothetical protein FRB99_008236 [Tulasnella sp. 403]
MAIVSRITFLIGALAATSLLVDPVVASSAVTARHLKHPQARAHHHVAANRQHRQQRRGKDGKKKHCAAKNPPSLNDLVATTTPTTSVEAPTTTSAPTSTTSSTKSHHSKSKTSSTQKSDPTPKTDDNSNDNSNNNPPVSTWGKAGIATNDGTAIDYAPYMATGKVTWCYTWSPWPCCEGDNCPESVPMLWSGKQVGDWNKLVVGKSFKNVLAFNEPDQDGQSSMSVGEAISLWYQYVKPVKARHGSPAVTSSPNGFKWIRDFMNGCGDCDVDYVTFHYYGMDADDFIAKVTSLHDEHNKPIWITEWACQNYGGNQDKQCSDSDASNFMRATQGFLDSTPWIERYSWFGALKELPGNFNDVNRIMTPGGKINALGRQYIGA